ncbi:ArsR/SmtB family transcription factor [Faucicola atlantae]|uniref:ArsR/SmtB family transcription factor n=1 Tax=Faucicola atlantae TaxID=34059 RepID=UPI0025AEF665|nr:metalloregulator ArsR/SmtB family transcription factor [Moraxella atlantae]
MKDRFLPYEFFKALGDPTRLSIIQLLHAKQSLCVCDIIDTLKQPQSTVSRHLNQLKTIGILTSERKGTWMWYAINADLADWCQAVITALPAFNAEAA